MSAAGKITANGGPNVFYSYDPGANKTTISAVLLRRHDNRSRLFRSAAAMCRSLTRQRSNTLITLKAPQSVARLVDTRAGQHERGDGSSGDIHLPGGFRSDVLSNGFTLSLDAPDGS